MISYAILAIFVAFTSSLPSAPAVANEQDLYIRFDGTEAGNCQNTQNACTAIKTAFNNFRSGENEFDINIISGITQEDVSLVIPNSQVNILGPEREDLHTQPAVGLVNVQNSVLFNVGGNNLRFYRVSIDQSPLRRSSHDAIVQVGLNGKVEFIYTYFLAAETGLPMQNPYALTNGSTVVIMGCNLNRGSQHDYTAFRFNSSNVTIGGCTFENLLFSANDGYLIYNNIGKLEIGETKFTNITAGMGIDACCLYILTGTGTSNTVELEDLTFTNCGSGIHPEGQEPGQYARPRSGAITLDLGNVSSTGATHGPVSITNCVFWRCIGQNGGAIFVRNGDSNLNFVDCDFYRCVGQDGNDIAFQLRRSNLRITETSFTTCRSNSDSPRIKTAPDTTTQDTGTVFQPLLDYFLQTFVGSQASYTTPRLLGGIRSKPLKNIDDAITEMHSFIGETRTVILLEDVTSIHVNYSTHPGILTIQPDEGIYRLNIDYTPLGINSSSQSTEIRGPMITVGYEAIFASRLSVKMGIDSNANITYPAEPLILVQGPLYTTNKSSSGTGVDTEAETTQFYPQLRLRQCDFTVADGLLTHGTFVRIVEGDVVIDNCVFADSTFHGSVVPTQTSGNRMIILPSAAIVFDDRLLWETTTDNVVRPLYQVTTRHSRLFILESTFRNLTHSSQTSQGGAALLAVFEQRDGPETGFDTFGGLPVSRIVQIHSSHFVGCQAGTNGYGGSIRFHKTLPEDRPSTPITPPPIVQENPALISETVGITIQGCIFKGNQASRGGAIAFTGERNNETASYFFIFHNVSFSWISFIDNIATATYTTTAGVRGSDIFFNSSRTTEAIGQMFELCRTNSEKHKIFIEPSTAIYDEWLRPYYNISEVRVRAEGDDSTWKGTEGQFMSTITNAATVTLPNIEGESEDEGEVIISQLHIILYRQTYDNESEINVLDRNIRITNLPKEQCPPFSHDLAIIRSRQLHFSRLFLVRAGKLDVDECEFSHNTLQWQREQQQWISGQGQFYSSLGVNDALIYMSGNGQITLSRCRLGRLTSGLESFLVADNGILNITTFSCIDTYELEQQPGDVGPPQVVSATFTFLKSAIGIGSDVKQAVISGANFHSVTTTQSEGSVLEIVLGDESVIEIKQSAFLKCQSANSGGGAIFIDTQYSRTTRNSQTNNNNNRHQYRRLNKNYKSRNEDASISIVECQFLNCTSSDQLRGSNTKAQVLGKTAVVGGGAVFIIGERPVTWFNRCFFQDNQVRLSVSANTTEYSLRWAVVGHDVHFGQLKTTDSDPALIFEDCYSQQTRSSGTIQQQRQKIHFEDQQQEGQYDVLLSVHFKTIYVARAGTSSTVLNTNAPIGTLQNPYPTINDAIIQMNTISKITTTVMVAHGIFAEQSQDIDTRIELVGSSPTWCVIRSSYATSGPLYKVIRSGDATLREFTITHRDPRSQESVLSVRGKGASLTVRQCVFKPAGMDKANENGAELSEESASVYDNINTRQLNQMLATQARNRPNTVEFSYTGRKLGNPVSHTEGSQDVPFGQRVQNSAYIEINGGSLALHSVTFEPTTVSGRQIPACVYGVKVRALTMFGVEFQRTIAEEDTEIGNWGAMHAVDVQMATVTATSAGEPHIPGIVLIKDCIFSGEQTSYLSDEAILEAEEEERLLYEEEKGKEQEWEDDYQPPSYDETNTNVDQTQNTEIHSSKPVIQTNDVSSQYTELPASHSFYYYRLPECGFGTPAVHIKGGIVAVVGTQFVKCIDGALRLTDVYNASIGSTNLFRDNWDELVDRGGIPITEEEAEEDVLKMVQWNQTFGQKNKKKISNRHLQPMSIESDAFEHFEKQVFCEGSTTLYGSIDSFVSNRLTDKEIEKIREQSVKEGKEKNKEPLWIMYDDDCNFGGELAQNGIVQSPYVVPNLKVIQSRSKKVTKNVIIPMSALAQKNEATANRIKDSLRKKKQNPDLFDVEIKAKVQENTLQIKGDYLSPCGRMFLELQDKKNEQLVLLIDLIEQTSEQPSISSNANEPTQLTSLDTLSVIKSGTWYSEKKIELKFDQLLSASADSYGVITDTVYSGGWKARLIFVKGKEQEGFWAGAEGRATKQKSISHWLAGWEIALIVIFVLLGVAIIIAIIIGLIMYNNKRKSGDVRDAYHARTQEPTRDVSDRSEQRNDEEMEQYAMEV